MEFDLERFYRINRRVLMWSLFFFLLYLLRSFFTLVFLTFILGFVGRQAAYELTTRTRITYRPAVILCYVTFLVLIAVFLVFAMPRLLGEGKDFARNRLPTLERTAVAEVSKLKAAYPFVDRIIEGKVAAMRSPESPSPRKTSGTATTIQAAGDDDSVSETSPEDILLLVQSYLGPLPRLILDFLTEVVAVTLQFLLAILLSFLILLDYTRIRHEVLHWRETSVGAFLHETGSSIVDFAAIVGRAFQCQFYVATLNSTLTLIGLTVLGIGPRVLLTAIVFIFGFIPVLGVFISSVPIILIALNVGGLTKALYALGMIVLIHMAEAYVFNPRVYAARFHINPVITLIILLIAHKLFGVWGMVLGIPVTYYFLTLAIRIPLSPRLRPSIEQLDDLPGSVEGLQSPQDIAIGGSAAIPHE